MSAGTISWRQLNTGRSRLGEFVGPVSSMRFATSLLTLIGIASVICVAPKQNEPMANQASAVTILAFLGVNMFPSGLHSYGAL